MLFERAVFAASGTILAHKLTLIMVTLTHGISAHLTEVSVVNYLLTRDVLHTAILTLVSMLTGVTSAELVIATTTLAGTIVSVTILVTVRSAVTNHCVTDRAADDVIHAVVTYFVLTYPSLTHTALAVQVLITGLVARTSVCNVTLSVVGYASVFTAISTFNVRLYCELAACGTVVIFISVTGLTFDIYQSAIVKAHAIEYAITLVAVEMLIGAYTLVRIELHLVLVNSVRSGIVMRNMRKRYDSSTFGAMHNVAGAVFTLVIYYTSVFVDTVEHHVTFVTVEMLVEVVALYIE